MNAGRRLELRIAASGFVVVPPRLDFAFSTVAEERVRFDGNDNFVRPYSILNATTDAASKRENRESTMFTWFRIYHDVSSVLNAIRS